MVQIKGLAGQARAFEAIQFGTRVDKAGFNLFVIGPVPCYPYHCTQSVHRRSSRSAPI
jgi:hypothetical protein